MEGWIFTFPTPTGKVFGHIAWSLHTLLAKDIHMPLIIALTSGTTTLKKMDLCLKAKMIWPLS